MPLLLSCLVVLVWASGEGSGCETGVAFERNVLSVPRSLMANADVALLKNFTADSVKQCMEQCCTGRFGACSVASFVRNSTAGNCLHFYCRPLPKCKFQPSDMTDSFSFSSNPTPAPSSSSSGPPPSTTPTAVALKNDNTTVKPRKGVDDPRQNVLGDLVTDKSSGIKPRKGVSLDDDLQPPFKSNVKARKGVDPSPTSSPAVIVTTRDDLLSDLAKILEDDTAVTTVKSSSSSAAVLSSSTTAQSPSTVVQSSSTVTTTSTTSIVVPTTTTKSPETSTTQTLTSTSLRTLVPVAPSIDVSTQQPPLVSSANRLVADEKEEEEENERRYKSSIHLVLALVFGLLVLFAVLGVAGKRIYDGWLRRDYYRMNYLIDGIYNGVE